MSGTKETVRSAEARTDPALDFDYNVLLDELVNSVPSELDPKTEVCVPMMIEKGLNNNMASRIVKEKEKSGELVSRPAMYRGQRVKAYRRA